MLGDTIIKNGVHKTFNERTKFALIKSEKEQNLLYQIRNITEFTLTKSEKEQNSH